MPCDVKNMFVSGGSECSVGSPACSCPDVPPGVPRVCTCNSGYSGNETACSGKHYIGE